LYPAVKNPAPSFGEQSDAVYLMVTLPGTNQGHGQHFVLGYVPINW
jgi:hypothetical protein